MKVAYLVNTYPQPSHSFIRREINAVERRGIEVHRFAMRHNRGQLVDPVDIKEHEKTEHVLSAAKTKLVYHTLATVLRAPGKSIAAWKLAKIGESRGGRSLLHTVAYFVEACYIAARSRQIGIDHIHAHFGTNATTVAMMVAALGGPAYSFTVHGPEEFDAPEAIGLGTKIRNAAFVVGISSFGRSQLCRWVEHEHWPKIKVVHCGVEPALFPEAAPIPTGPLKLAAIGRFTEQKGQLLLIEALAAAVARQPDVHLTLIGDGEMRPQIEATIEQLKLGGNVTITGWVDESRIRAELANAHALIMPSFAEGLPMVIMEAMAAGRPVIATYVAGTPELVRPNENGWMVPAGDSQALAEAIVALADTPRERLAEMGLLARERALARHDIDVEAGKLAAHFTASHRAP